MYIQQVLEWNHVEVSRSSPLNRLQKFICWLFRISPIVAYYWTFDLCFSDVLVFHSNDIIVNEEGQTFFVLKVSPETKTIRVRSLEASKQITLSGEVRILGNAVLEN